MNFPAAAAALGAECDRVNGQTVQVGVMKACALYYPSLPTDKDVMPRE